jgi:hypothetical protein
VFLQVFPPRRKKKLRGAAGMCFHTAYTRGLPMSEKPSTTLPGTVEKIIKPVSPDEPEKAQIAVEGADDLYREIRIDNTLTKSNGDQVRLKPGAEVEVTVEAPLSATTPKVENRPQQ